MGYIAASNENYKLSKQLFDQVIKQYPSSSAARLAEARLQKMKKASQL
jgi:TolA-binding protein